MRPCLFIALMVATCMPVSTTWAQADARKVALVGFGDALERAVRAALEPWNVQIVIVAGPSPGATAPRANAVARDCARDNAVAAVVWISEYNQGHALWIYDVGTDQVVARPLPRPPPFDEATAAAVALSVKTLLRHSSTAPESERFGAVQRAAPPAVRAAVPTTDRGQTAVIAPPHFDFESVAGVRGGRTHPSFYEPRLGLGLVWWPDAGWLASVIALSIGPGLEVIDPRFQGRLVDAEVVLAARLRRRFGANLQLSAAVGPGTQVTFLDGTVLSAAQHARVLRVEPAVHGELQADWRFTPWLRLGVRGTGLWMLRTQRYVVEGVPVLAISRLGLEVGLVLGISVPN